MQHRKPDLHIQRSLGEPLEAIPLRSRREIGSRGRHALAQHHLGKAEATNGPLVDVIRLHLIARGIGAAAQGADHGDRRSDRHGMLT